MNLMTDGAGGALWSSEWVIYNELVIWMSKWRETTVTNILKTITTTKPTHQRRKHHIQWPDIPILIFQGWKSNMSYFQWLVVNLSGTIFSFEWFVWIIKSLKRHLWLLKGQVAFLQWGHKMIHQLIMRIISILTHQDSKITRLQPCFHAQPCWLGDKEREDKTGWTVLIQHYWLLCDVKELQTSTFSHSWFLTWAAGISGHIRKQGWFQ